MSKLPEGLAAELQDAARIITQILLKYYPFAQTLPSILRQSDSHYLQLQSQWIQRIPYDFLKNLQEWLILQAENFDGQLDIQRNLLYHAGFRIQNNTLVPVDPLENDTTP
jgi:hypothetical protein